MTVSKVYYYERASVFDRGLILLLGIACMFLVNMKTNCPPCKDYEKLVDAIKNKEDNLRRSQLYGAVEQGAVEQRKTSESFDSNKSSGKTTSGAGGKTWKKKDWNSGSKKLSSGIKLSEKDSSSSVIEKSSTDKSAKTSKDGVDGKNWQEGWKEKNKDIIKKRKAEKTGTLPGGIPADTLWKNKHDIVHIMTTRYMQLQPDLINLGKARNDLFRTFTLPSVVAQSNQEFVWIIFTDPDLNAVLLEEVIDMIKPYKNILLLGMNNGMNNFRSAGWMTNIKEVFSGDLQLLKDYRVASKSRVLLETRIDADDSIFVDMIDAVQKQAADTMGKRAKEHNYDKDKIAKEYRIFCTEHHLEWGYFNPWEKSSTKGHLFGVSHEEFCISAGLTYGYQVGTDKDSLPTVSHHKMSVEIPTCKKSSNNRNCLERINAGDYKYIMLRSRTPTSAGMLGVIPTQEVVNSETWKNQQDWGWENVIEKNFAIKPQSIWDLRERLKKNMVDILTDALKGQCTKAEFTCKDTTKRDLNNLLKEVSDNS